MSPSLPGRLGILSRPSADTAPPHSTPPPTISRRRKTYDRTGSLQDSEGLSSGQFDSLYAFYRDLYKPVTEDDIDTFSAQHRGSAEEEAEVLQYYTRFQGDMNTVFQWVVLSGPKKDSHRFMDLVDTAINAGEAKRYKQYTIWAKKVSATPRPADPLAPPKKKKNAKKAAGKSSELALVDQIRCAAAAHPPYVLCPLPGCAAVRCVFSAARSSHFLGCLQEQGGQWIQQFD